MAHFRNIEIDEGLLNQEKIGMTIFYKGLHLVPRLRREDAIDYYHQRIVWCRDPLMIRLANQYLLGKLKGPAKLLTISQTTQSHSLNLTYDSSTQGSTLPDYRIQVKRGMVLRVLDNVGLEGRISIDDRVVLSHISRDTLTVSPLVGEAKGMDVILR
ncbi:hypothetical protein PSHT_12585, partial [Puccinia striiformis]